MDRISKRQYYLKIAKAVSERSTCLRRRYGCVIIKNDEVIATGYNGSPRNEKNCCDVYMECPRKDMEHNSGDYSDCPAVHAEQNAMLSAARKDMIGSVMYLWGEEFIKGYDKITDGYWVDLKECVPCPICMRMLKNAGILQVVTNNGDIIL